MKGMLEAMKCSRLYTLPLEVLPAQIASLAYTGWYSMPLHDRQGPPAPPISCITRAATWAVR